jgi:hypothetical protein
MSSVLRTACRGSVLPIAVQYETFYAAIYVPGTRFTVEVAACAMYHRQGQGWIHLQSTMDFSIMILYLASWILLLVFIEGVLCKFILSDSRLELI